MSRHQINTTNDHIILSRIKQGNEDAFALLVVQYRRRVFTHCLTFTARYEEAEELTQDIFIRVWQNRAALDEIESFADYLFLISRNYLISYIRKRVMDITTPNPETLVDELMLPDRQTEIKELQTLIQDGIAHMPDKQQAVFKLSRLEDLSYEDISKRLGISKSTVKWHIIAGINFLKQYIRQHGSYNLAVIITCILSTLKKN